MITSDYAAGFFDGEGTVTASARRRVWKKRKATTRRTPFFLLSVTITNTHLATLIAFKERWQGSVCTAPTGQNCKPKWIWRCTGRYAAAFIKDVAPHLVIKKEVAALGLELHEMPRYRGVGRWMTDDEMEAVYNQRLPIVAKIRKLNQRGTLPQRTCDYKQSGVDWYALAAQKGTRDAVVA